ncbi:unnamed protein product, partial [Polarella glacialis]
GFEVLQIWLQPLKTRVAEMLDSAADKFLGSAAASAQSEVGRSGNGIPRLQEEPYGDAEESLVLKRPAALVELDGIDFFEESSRTETEEVKEQGGPEEDSDSRVPSPNFGKRGMPAEAASAAPTTSNTTYWRSNG